MSSNFSLWLRDAKRETLAIASKLVCKHCGHPLQRHIGISLYCPDAHTATSFEVQS